jgi:hypothetical protein
MMIYQATKENGDLEWVFNDGKSKQRFATEGEAQAAAGGAMSIEQKQKFAGGMIDLITALAQIDDRGDNASAVWFARGYNAGDTAITDADVAALGLTANDVLSMVIIVDGLRTYLGDQGRRGVLSKFRSDI